MQLILHLILYFLLLLFVLAAFHFNTKRKFVLPPQRRRRRSCCCFCWCSSCCCCSRCCCCARWKEIYVHYRLFLSDDVNFVAFLAFAACSMFSVSVYVCVCVCVCLCCTLQVASCLVTVALKGSSEFSWRCLSCLINVVLDCCCCSCCTVIAWQHLICCAHALATLLLPQWFQMLPTRFAHDFSAISHFI